MNITSAVSIAFSLGGVAALALSYYYSPLKKKEEIVIDTDSLADFLSLQFHSGVCHGQQHPTALPLKENNIHIVAAASAHHFKEAAKDVAKCITKKKS